MPANELTWLEKEDLAAKLLAKAEKLVADKKLVSAHAELDRICNTYPGTEGADKAAKQRASVAKMPGFAKLMADHTASRLYQLGANYLRNGLTEQAKACFGKLIEQQPDSTWAKRAREKLES